MTEEEKNDHEATAEALGRAEGIAAEQAPSPAVAEALQRVEEKVSKTLADTTAYHSTPLTRMQTWVLTGLLLGVQALTAILLITHISSQHDRIDERQNHEQTVERQLEGIACVLVTTQTGERTPADAARCQVDYIPGPVKQR